MLVVSEYAIDGSKSLPPLKYESCSDGMCVKDACGRWIALFEMEEGAASMALEEVDGFDGVDGGVDGVDGFDDGVDGGPMASMASMAAMDGVDGFDGWRRWWWTGVFDTEGTDVEVPLCPQ